MINNIDNINTMDNINTINTININQCFSIFIFWIIVIIIIFITLITFIVIAPLTFILWLYQLILNKKHPIYANYYLKEGRECSKFNILKSKKINCKEIKSVWTDVPNMGLKKNEIWKCHSLFVSCDDKNDKDNRPYMVLIHGTGSCSLVWENIFSQLSLNFRIIAIDLPGFGQSPTPSCLINACAVQAQKYLVEFLRVWFNTLGIIDKVILLGHSYGSFISIHFTKCYPEKVKSVILFNTVGILPTLGEYGAYWAVFFNLSPIQSCIRFLGPLGIWIAYTWFLQLKANEETYYWFQLLAEPTAIGDLLVARNINVNWKIGEAFWNNPALKTLTQLKSTVTFIYGECDTITPYHQGQLFSKLLGSNIKCIKLINTGHTINIKSSNYFTKIIKDACSSAGKVDQVAKVFGNNIPNNEFLSYRSYWNKQDTVRIINNLYFWLQQIREYNL